MAALVAAIHVFFVANQDVDGRHKAGHDVERVVGIRPDSAMRPAFPSAAASNIRNLQQPRGVVAEDRGLLRS
jgi:hypothetical protein